MKNDEGMGIVFNAPVTVGTFVKVESGATYIKNKFDNVEHFHEADEEESLVEDGVDEDKELLSVFMGDKEEMERYLKAIEGATDKQVASITKDFVRRGVISSIAKNKRLYDILMAKGMYSCSLSNWNKMLR